MTLDELLAELTEGGKRPEDFRVCNPMWRSISWFRPYFRTVEGKWHGKLEGGDHEFFDAVADPKWELYTEPKPKVKRAMYAVRYANQETPWPTNYFYKDETELRRHIHSETLLIIKRLDYTEIECDK